VTVAVRLLVIEPAVAANEAEVAAAATVTDVGTLRSPALLERETKAPPAGAAFDSVTVQVAVVPLLRLDGLHDTELTTGGAFGAAKVRVAVWEAP
jgi:hypothetical protein